MPFGLTNAPTTFQAALTTEFRDLLDRSVLIYLDDILVYSRTLDEHLIHLCVVLDRLRAAKYKANRDTCEFARQELESLGHYVTPKGIRPLADKIQAIVDWPEPRCTTDVRSFMGLVGYYQRFVESYSKVAAPLSRLQSPKVPFEFDDADRGAFNTLKAAMQDASALRIYDPTLPTQVTTDASGYGIGAVLEQCHTDGWHPVECLPSTLSTMQGRKSYSRSSPFSNGRRRFRWNTDNNPLLFYKTQDTVTSTIGRWMYYIDQFDFESCHIPSPANRGADALSRRPDLCALVTTTFDLDDDLQQHFVNGYKSDLTLCFMRTYHRITRWLVIIQEDIHNLDEAVQTHNQVFDQVTSRLQQLEQTVAASVASSSNTFVRLEALEIDVGYLKDGVQLQQTATQQLEQRICTAATHSSSEPRETTPRFDDQEVFCDSTKTDPIPWFHKFELKLQLHHISEHKHHAYLYSRLGGACQAWLDNLLSKYGVVVVNLHTKISWDDLKAAWHRRFQVEPPKIKAMNKLMVFEQGTLPSVDWIAKYQRLTSIPDIQMGFKAIKHYFISRSSPALSNALPHVKDTLTTPAELFDMPHRLFTVYYSSSAPFDSVPSGDRKVIPRQPDEIGLRFLRTVAIADSSPTDLSSDPRMVRLLDEFADIFESPTGVVPDRSISHEIILEAGAVLPKGCIYRMSEEELTVLRAQLDDLLDKGWIRPSSSLYGAPVLFVRKKNKDLRLCIDYRKLNAQTVKNAGPLPRIDDLLERLGGVEYFSKLDLKSGYHQISIRPNDRYKSMFKTRYGHFEWVFMPFSLTNAPTTFQAAMTNEFRAMLDRFMLVYLDDILVYSLTLEDHLGNLRQVLETLCRAKYKTNRDKCEFVKQELEYLGHFVTPEGISLLSDKIQAIQEWPEPQNVTDVRSFLGLAGYYQRFIKGYLKIAAHLSKLQCEDRSFDFGEDVRESFLALKAALLSLEVLRIYDPLLPTRVTTDASGYGIGVVLEQHEDVTRHPVEYFNKKVPAVHSIDDARKKELLTFVHELKRWRHFLLGRS
ncbi:hypothetical protein CBR_g6659 [Chara braunii]|uniref:Reverse transcriptase domain-containing protein n=1 Tax=Chara braunii TaxID=69332 RepID=A0A388KKE8_CHABU|nr:hypothetical protein CBR_g6659 [Chara braunii]|eukprot:GBG70531.1 hypothetical protein CBR_g6659 [Chara braunii]